jgi:opacity protein-like surface antigen
MKKVLSTLSLLLIINIISVQAQMSAGAAATSTPDYEHKVEISAMVGYMMNGSINFYGGDIKFSNEIDYEFALAVNTGYGTFAEVNYTFSSSIATFRDYYTGLGSEDVNVDIHYIQIGGVKEFTDTRARPYGTLSIGASGFVPEDTTIDSWWSFALNLGLGVKISLNETIGIKLQGRLMMPLAYSGVGFFCGSGGCGGGVTATSPLIQGDFSGGLVFGF